jgi:hypothetical protein
VRRPDEIITELPLPLWPIGRRWAFREFAQRQGDFALAGIALFDDEGNPARDSFYRRLGSSISGDAAALRRIAAEDLPDRG